METFFAYVKIQGDKNNQNIFYVFNFDISELLSTLTCFQTFDVISNSGKKFSTPISKFKKFKPRNTNRHPLSILIFSISVISKHVCIWQLHHFSACVHFDVRQHNQQARKHKYVLSQNIITDVYIVCDADQIFESYSSVKIATHHRSTPFSTASLFHYTFPYVV